ncbi:MAG: 50S ribosomal protein L6 [Clostridia bacterium 62_21]|nr:MAG: 50S ribosomal protein L6 [Clostridia bacterium 62_21]
MSRVGKKPVDIPRGVDIKLEGNIITVKGPRGQLRRELPARVSVVMQDGKLMVERASDEPRDRSVHGLARTLVANMVEGVANGFQKSLELVGVGYRAAKQGKKLVLTVGYSHPVEIEPPEGIEIEVPAPNKIIVKGADKELVGQVAARIRAVKEPEPYKGKGIRYEGEFIRTKAGKAGAKK